MSSRALRKAQREKEEHDRLKQLEQEARSLENDDEEDVDGEGGEEEQEQDLFVMPTRKSAFAILQAEEDEPEEVDEPEQAAEDQPGIAVRSSSAKKKKKKKKKSKEPAVTTPAGENGQLDEIDIALKQLSTNNKSSQSAATSAGADQTQDEANRLLAIDTNHLHAQNEMRRLFGRAALQHDDDDQPPPEAVGGNRRQQRQVQHVGLAQALRGQRMEGRSGGLAAMALRRNIFIQGKEDWPVATGGGLGMEVEEKRSDGTTLYRFVHNTAYQDVQSQFETCVASMDPNRLIALLRLNPYHISTLLQVSEISKQERDHTTSGDLLERALFSFGRAVHSTFAKNLAQGKARLDFRRAENREFWLASWRYMQNLTMRGTWRTVYEWAKFLISLSPQDDPYALWLVLDQYALRSRQDLDYLNISQNSTHKQTHCSMPNVQISRGLAEFRAGNQSKGKQSLFTAVGRFPWIIARLMQELGLDPPPAIWGKEPRSPREKLYAEMYATRAKDVWNTPEASNFLVEVASALQPETEAVPIDTNGIERNEARHVLLSDTPSLIALVPRSFTSQLESSSDPLPPNDAFESHPSQQARNSNSAGGDRQFVRMEESFEEIVSLTGFFSRLFPWFEPRVPGDEGEDRETDSDAGERRPPVDHETLMRQVEDAGVSRQEFEERAHRLGQLQEELFGGPVSAGAEMFLGQEDAEHHYHARAETASDDD